jgi:hypothetical protein
MRRAAIAASRPRPFSSPSKRQIPPSHRCADWQAGEGKVSEVKCTICKDSAWVCENHPRRPWMDGSHAVAVPLAPRMQFRKWRRHSLLAVRLQDGSRQGLLVALSDSRPDQPANHPSAASASRMAWWSSTRLAPKHAWTRSSRTAFQSGERRRGGSTAINMKAPTSRNVLKPQAHPSAFALTESALHRLFI